MPFDGITTGAIAAELSEKLVGGKIDKINQAEKDELLFVIRSNQQNHRLLISANSANPRIHLVREYKKENPLQAPMFLMLLRKHLGGGRILSVAQNGFDRQILIDIEAYDELRTLRQKTLSVEIMGKHSNIILIDKAENIIIDSIKRVPLSVSSIREVLPQRPFIRPPAQDKLNPLEPITLERFRSALKAKSQPVYRAIYTTFDGISPVSAKQICYMANLTDSDTTFELSPIRYERLKNSFDRIFELVASKDFSPCIVYEKNGSVADFSAVMLTVYDETHRVQQRGSVSEAAEEFYIGKDFKERLSQRTYGLRKSVQTKLDRIRAKLRKQAEEINEAQALDKYSQIGELLTANIYQLKQGMKSVELIDYNDPEMRTVTIELSEHLSPSQNIQAYYKRYAKAKSRIRELTGQLQQTQDEIEYLENVLLSIDHIDNLSEIDDIREELIRGGYYSAASGSRQKKKPALSEPMEFLSSDGYTIWVGKNNVQNDQLTLKRSAPTDLWLHTKNIPGSHVIVQKKDRRVSDTTLYEAALLSAYYSKARTSSQVPVDYTERKNVKKPSGARPGMVIYDSYKTLYVTPDENKLPQRIK